MLVKVRRLILPVLSIVLLGGLFLPSLVLAQGKDELAACIEEVKQIKEKEGENWYTKNKTSCLGKEAIGEWSVLRLTDFDKREVYNDMELEFYAYFDVPVAGAEARKGQMEYQKTSKPESQPPGYKREKKVEDPGIGDQSQHQIETTDLDIAFGYDNFSPVWVSNVIYQELMVIVGDCSFMVGGRAGRGDSWSFNHRVDWKNDVVINSDHDHGEGVVKERMQEYARGVVSRVSGVCGSFGGATETKKGGLVDWAKGLLGRRETAIEKTGEEPSPVPGEYWEKVEFRQWAEGASNKVNNWIMENLGVSEIKIETTEKTPSPPPIVERITESRLLPGAVIKNYRDGVIVELDKGGWVYIPPTGEVIYGSDRWRQYFEILLGELEIETEATNIEVEAPNVTVKSKGTHYWVSYDAVKRVTTVGVYDGEVEVTIRDGKTITLAPDGDKPMAVVIAQNLSSIKVGALSLGMVGIVGAVFFFLRRRFARAINLG